MALAIEHHWPTHASLDCIVIATNLDFDEWVSVFGDAKLTNACSIELHASSSIIENKNESYRFNQSQ